MYELDCIPTPKDSNVAVARECLAMLSVLPDNFTLIPRLLPVRDQGLKGCCVAHAITCMKEGQTRTQRYLSPEFIYNLRPNRPESGMYIQDALQIVKDYGSLYEKSYPYDYDTEPKRSFNQRLLEKAARFKINGFARIQDIDEMKHSLYECGPCPIAFPVYSINGKIWNQTSDSKHMGYHAMAAVGWNSEGFVLRNSWGPGWGAGGYIIYPYEEWGVHCEAWTAYTEPLPPTTLWKSISWKRILTT